MDEAAQLKLQAYLDGELPEREVEEVRAWAAGNAEAGALLAELKNTNAALAGFEEDVKLPETREFFWSKIEREIGRLERPEEAPKPGVGWAGWLLRHWIPTSGVAAGVCTVALLVLLQMGGAEAQSADMQLNSKDMGAYTYRDQKSGMTMIWFYDRKD